MYIFISAVSPLRLDEVRHRRGLLTDSSLLWPFLRCRGVYSFLPSELILRRCCVPSFWAKAHWNGFIRFARSLHPLIRIRLPFTSIITNTINILIPHHSVTRIFTTVIVAAVVIATTFTTNYHQLGFFCPRKGGWVLANRNFHPPRSVGSVSDRSCHVFFSVRSFLEAVREWMRSCEGPVPDRSCRSTTSRVCVYVLFITIFITSHAGKLLWLGQSGRPNLPAPNKSKESWSPPHRQTIVWCPLSNVSASCVSATEVLFFAFRQSSVRVISITHSLRKSSDDRNGNGSASTKKSLGIQLNISVRRSFGTFDSTWWSSHGTKGG